MAESERFEVDLPTDLAQFVHSQVGQGALACDSDVVREAVRVMQAQAGKVAALRALVNASIDDKRPGVTAEEVDVWLDQRALSRGVCGDHA